MKEILQYLIENLVCSGILWGVYRLLLHRRVSFRAERLYLIGSMVAAIVIPMLQIPVWRASIVPVDGTPGLVGATPAPIHTASATAPTTNLVPPLLLILYVGGVLLLSFRLLRQLWDIHRLRRSAAIEHTGSIELIRHAHPLPPFSFLRTIYINSHTPGDLLPAILAHEESHIRHRHSRERIVIESMKVFCWWNPFLWLAARDLEEVQEFEADHDVIAQGYRPADYMEIIFKQLFGYSPDIANGLRNSLTKKRLKMMTTKRGSRYALLRLTATVPVVVALLMAFGSTTKAAEVVAHQKSTTETSLPQVESSPLIAKPAPGEAPLKGNQVDVMPKFQEGGIDVFSDWVGSRLKYPDMNVEGEVIVQFVVQSDGTLSDIEILRSPGQAFSEEVIRVLNTSPRWTPGIKDGKNASVTFMLPIEFRSTGKKGK